MKRLASMLFLLVFLCACSSVQAEEQAKPAFGQGIMVGEVTDTSAIVQVRVTQGKKLIDGDTFEDGDALRDGDLQGAEGSVRFYYWQEGGNKTGTPKILDSKEQTDHIVRVVLRDLKPNTTYRCQAVRVAEEADSNESRLEEIPGPVATFKTHPGKDTSAPVRFTLTSCMNYDKFIGNDVRGIRGGKAYEGDDRHLGYPAAEAVRKQNPDFVIYAGDVIYYDKQPKVKTLADMRAKWHRQNNLPRMIALHAPRANAVAFSRFL